MFLAQKSTSSNLFFLVAVMSVFLSCKKDFEGDKNDIATPETFLVVDSIYRSGDNRYTTTIEAHWWGTVQAGFIKGYEVSIDNQQTWTFTTKQSDVFLLTLPVGADTADIVVFVRTIDNNGTADPTPASTAFPVKNSPPVISFDYTYPNTKKNTAFPAFRYGWKFTDADGAVDISAIEVCFNDTMLKVSLPLTVMASSFVAEKVNNTFTGNWFIYNNTQTTAFSQKITGIGFDSLNFFYVRAIDRSGAKSPWTKDSIFIKKPQASGILFINDYNSTKTIITNFYTNRIKSLGLTYQVFDTVKSFVDEFPNDLFTITKAFDFFNRIVWVSDFPSTALGIAQTSTIPFFAKGGKLFMVLQIPNDVAFDAPIFNFTPIQQLVVDTTPARTFKMAPGDRIISYKNGPELKATSIVDIARPFITYSSSSGLYAYDSLAKAELRSFGSGNPTVWMGTSTVMSKRINTQTNKTDFITLTVPLNLMNGNNNVDSFFKQVIINELAF